MRISQSFRKTITATMLGVAISAVLLVGISWLGQEYVQFQSVSGSMKDQYLQEQRKMIKDEVDRVIQYIQYKRIQTEQKLQDNLQERVKEAIAVSENIYRNHAGKVDNTEIIKLLTQALRPIRFNDGRGYYFIYKMDGTNIMLPFSPQLEGTSLLNLQDSKGDYTIKRAQKIISESGEGFQSWFWYKPEDRSQMRKKVGYIQQFQPLGIWIGTGEYVDDFEEIIKKEILDWVNSIKYGDDGYIFISDYQANTLAHYNKEYVGKNRWELRDSNNVAIMQEFIGLAQNEDGGYLEYVGTIRPSTGLAGSKIGYARGITDWQWIVGTGVYVDTINVQIEAMRGDLVHNIRKNLLIICMILLICVIIIGLLSRFLAAKISTDLVLFLDFFKDAARTGQKIEVSNVNLIEFQEVAQAANNMIDEQGRMESELMKIQEQLLQSRKMEALGLLAGGVAHDLNNVLSAIVGYPDLLVGSFPKESIQQKYLKTIKDSGQKAADIVEDLLTLARRVGTQRVVIDINIAVEEYLQFPEYERTLASHPGIVVETSLEPSLLKIKGSQVHFQKAVMNLVNNAAEAQPGGGRIMISTENRYLDEPLMGYQKIQVGEYVVLSVTDKGTGIAREDLDRIFEPFFSKKTLGRSGTGLGMAVVWGTVQDHEGYVNIKTCENEGTTFELYFPATREDIVGKVALPHPIEYLGHGEHILVVDDIAEQRALVRALLQELGYTSTEVGSGQAAIDFLKENRADLVVLDMIMEDPEMDGLETFRHIVRLNSKQKALIASGYAETDRVKTALELGVAKYVKKPYTLEAIGMTIHEILRGATEPY